MNREDIAYIAGLFDGEGYIGSPVVTLYKRRRLSFKLSMTDEAAVRACHELTGLGTFWIDTRKTKTGRTVFAWQASGRYAAQIAMLLYPFLRTKRKQVEEAVSLWLNEWKPLRANWR